MRWKWAILLGVGIFLCINSVLRTARADDMGSKWITNGQPSVRVEVMPTDSPPLGVVDCIRMTVPVVLDMQSPPKMTSICVTEGKDIDVGYFYDKIITTMAVRFKSDSVFHMLNLDVAEGAAVQFIKSANTLVAANGGLAYADLTKQLIPLERDPRTNEVTLYGVTMKNISLKDPDPQDHYPLEFEVMVNNGRLGIATGDGPYILINLQAPRLLNNNAVPFGFMKVNILTGETTFIASYDDGRDNGDFLSPTNPYIGAISADGRYVFLGGTKFLIYDTANCGDSITMANKKYHESSWFAKYSMNSPCPRIDMTNAVNTEHAEGMVPYRYGKFSNDDHELSFVVEETVTDLKKMTISAPGYRPEYTTPPLDYLALGDSYSSGEGDVTDGNSHYLYNENQCHLSGRSYPFLLKDYWGLTSASMASVACSGAKVLPDYIGEGDYYGQHKQMARWDDPSVTEARSTALEKFTPGITRQIEFVKRYKPEKVTFTGGGNDVGFASILEYCAASYRLAGFLPIDETCAFASNQQMRANLNKTIDDQYNINKLLVEKIREASPATKIYMIGYPQFVAVEGLSCANDSVILNKAERQLIHDSVSRLNNALKKVAHDTGVYYVDIENSLEGGEICQGSEYMTGPLKMIVSNQSFDEDPNMFHPNASGHKKIAEVIERQFTTGMNYTILDIPGEQDGIRTVRTAVMPDYSGVGSTNTITMDPGVFMPDGEVSIELFSQVTSLGTARVAGDGTLRANVTLPKGVIPGYHLITITGTDVDGNPVQVQQFITITSGIINDIDGDGMLDQEDTCNFITEWYIDGKNTCLPQATSNSTSTSSSNQISLYSKESLPSPQSNTFSDTLNTQAIRVSPPKQPLNMINNAARIKTENNLKTLYFPIIVIIILIIGVTVLSKRGT